jgi:Type III secretion protein (HpaP)
MDPPRTVEPAAAVRAPITSTLLRQHEGPRAPPRPKHATSAADDIERLIDELAEFVLRQPGARAQSWSVTLWLRASVLRDTCLTMSGEPGRIAISFATDNAASLRRLHAGHEALQARLRERIAVPTLDVTIDAATRPEESHA